MFSSPHSSATVSARLPHSSSPQYLTNELSLSDNYRDDFDIALIERLDARYRKVATTTTAIMSLEQKNDSSAYDGDVLTQQRNAIEAPGTGSSNSGSQKPSKKRIFEDEGVRFSSNTKCDGKPQVVRSLKVELMPPSDTDLSNEALLSSAEQYLLGAEEQLRLIEQMSELQERGERLLTDNQEKLATTKEALLDCSGNPSKKYFINTAMPLLTTFQKCLEECRSLQEECVLNVSSCLRVVQRSGLQPLSSPLHDVNGCQTVTKGYANNLASTLAMLSVFKQLLRASEKSSRRIAQSAGMLRTHLNSLFESKEYFETIMKSLFNSISGVRDAVTTLIAEHDPLFNCFSTAIFLTQRVLTDRMKSLPTLNALIETTITTFAAAAADSQSSNQVDKQQQQQQQELRCLQEDQLLSLTKEISQIESKMSTLRHSSEQSIRPPHPMYFIQVRRKQVSKLLALIDAMSIDIAQLHSAVKFISGEQSQVHFKELMERTIATHKNFVQSNILIADLQDEKAKTQRQMNDNPIFLRCFQKFLDKKCQIMDEAIQRIEEKSATERNEIHRLTFAQQRGSSLKGIHQQASGGSINSSGGYTRQPIFGSSHVPSPLKNNLQQQQHSQQTLQNQMSITFQQPQPFQSSNTLPQQTQSSNGMIRISQLLQQSEVKDSSKKWETMLSTILKGSRGMFPIDADVKDVIQVLRNQEQSLKEAAALSKSGQQVRLSQQMISNPAEINEIVGQQIHLPSPSDDGPPSSPETTASTFHRALEVTTFWVTSCEEFLLLGIDSTDSLNDAAESRLERKEFFVAAFAAERLSLRIPEESLEQIREDIHCSFEVILRHVLKVPSRTLTMFQISSILERAQQSKQSCEDMLLHRQLVFDLADAAKYLGSKVKARKVEETSKDEDEKKLERIQAKLIEFLASSDFLQMMGRCSGKFFMLAKCRALYENVIPATGENQRVCSAHLIAARQQISLVSRSSLIKDILSREFNCRFSLKVLEEREDSARFTTVLQEYLRIAGGIDGGKAFSIDRNHNLARDVEAFTEENKASIVSTLVISETTTTSLSLLYGFAMAFSAVHPSIRGDEGVQTNNFDAVFIDNQFSQEFFIAQSDNVEVLLNCDQLLERLRQAHHANREIAKDVKLSPPIGLIEEIHGCSKIKSLRSSIDLVRWKEIFKKAWRVTAANTGSASADPNTIYRIPDLTQTQRLYVRAFVNSLHRKHSELFQS